MGLLMLIVWIKTKVFFHFSILYTDCDQAVLWQTLHDISEGNFFQPCFYGQAYNSGLESILAWPLYAMGMKEYYALPLVSILISLLPYLILALLFIRKKDWWAAIFTLLLYLWLPPFYDLFTALPRGFVTGLFACSFLLPAWFFPENKKVLALASFALPFVFWLNFNTVIFLVPFLVKLALAHYKKPISFFVFYFILTVPGLVWILFTRNFYLTHPHYLVHSIEISKFKWKYIYEFWTNWNNWLGYLTPGLWKFSQLVFIFLLIPIITFIRTKNREMLLIYLTFLGILVFSTGFEKIKDGVSSDIFFPLSRMFLCFTLMLILFLAPIFSAWMKRFQASWISLLAIVALSSMITFQKHNELAIRSKWDFINKQEIRVQQMPIEHVYYKCNELQQISNQYKPDLIVFAINETYEFNYLLLPYACPCLVDDLPTTIVKSYDRRGHLITKIKRDKFHRILVLNKQETLEKRVQSDPKHYQKIKARENSYFLFESKEGITWLDFNFSISNYQERIRFRP